MVGPSALRGTGLSSHHKGSTMPEQNNKLPFSMGYVLAHTAKHVRKSIDISINKTSARWPEFLDTDKSKEITITLMRLHKLRSDIDALFNPVIKEAKEYGNAKEQSAT
jgi:hypothetical protein